MDFIKRIINLQLFRRKSTRRFYIFLICLIVISGLFAQYLYASLYGVPPGYTGAPFDGVTCATAGCHPGPPKEVTGWVTSDVPVTGYIPGDTYNITLTASRPNTAKFGFQVTAQSDAGSEGYFILVDSTNTQYAVNNKYVTHTLNGASGTNQKAWNMKWVAPLQPGWDPVSIFASFVAGVYNLNDEVYISSVTMGINQSVPALSHSKQEPRIYPNPFNTMLILRWPYSGDPVRKATLISAEGKQVFAVINPPERVGEYSFYTGAVPAGVYFLEVNSASRRFSGKVVRCEIRF